MLFVIEILGQPDRDGIASVIERRTHTGPTVTEALRTAQANLRSPPPSAYSFSMRANGKEVGHWRRSDGGRKADILADLKSAKSGPEESKSAMSESAKSESAMSESAKSESAKSKSATSESAKSRSARSTPAELRLPSKDGE